MTYATSKIHHPAADQLYESLFLRNPTAMFTYDPTTGLFVETNAAMLALTGYTRHELIGQPVSLIRGDGASSDVPTGPGFVEAIRFRDRRMVRVELRAHEGNGGGLRLVTLFDVTEREGARDRLERTETQLRHAQKMDALGRLAGSVAHDFNNILTVVGSYASMLEDSLDSDDQRRDDATEIRLATERATQLTRRLLALSRHSIVTPKPLQLDGVVASFAPVMRRLLGEGIQLEIQRGDVPAILADVGQLEQVLMNLAVNARDAMDKTGALTIETSLAHLGADEALQVGITSGTYAVLAVTDSGCGIPAELQDRIFEPFFTTKDAAHGTGLGLSIVHGIITQAKGAISVFSRVGHGTTFRIYLPVGEGLVPRDEPQLPPTPATLPRITVLVVDDQPELRAAATRVLHDAGCTVLEAANGAAARKASVSHDGPIDVAIVDVVLSDGRGDLLARELRELRPGLQILLTSGYPAGALGPSGEAPAGLLAKPYLPSQLREAVARIAEPSGASRRSEPSLQPRVLLVDDDADLRKMLTRLLRRAQFEVVEVESGRKALAQLESRRFDVVLSDVHMPDGDGLDLLRGVRRLDLDLPVILISGKPDVASAAKALEFGAFRYLTKPLDTEHVESVVRHATRARAMARIRRQATTINGVTPNAGDRAGLEVRFDHALEQLWMAFQPIFDAHTGALFGVEALMRSREPSIPHPGAILEAATQLGRLPQLGRRTRHLAASTLLTRPDIPALFMNLHPDDLLDIDLVNADALLTRIAPRVILEVTEREALASSAQLTERIGRLRMLGFRIAIDDIGAGYSGLTSFADLMPEVVKIDMSLVRSVHTSTVKQRTIGALCSLCHEMGALVVGEGVETADERSCLISLGCDLLQGYLLGKPQPTLPEM